MKSLLALLLLVSCLAKKDPLLKDKKVLNLSSQPIAELDVHLRSDLASGKVLGLIHESLYSSNPYNKLGPLLPELAVGLPKISTSGLEYTFEIVPNVLYHPHPCWEKSKTPRRAVEARDFITAIKRMADPHFHSGSFGYWKNYISDLEAWRDSPAHANKTNYQLPIEGAQAPSPTRLELKFSEASAGHLYRLATLAVTPIPQELVECLNAKSFDLPLGSGPFRVKSFERNHRLILEKNPEYRGRPHPLDQTLPKAPYLSGIVYTFSTESYNAQLQFLKGELDYLELTKDNQSGALSLEGTLGPEYKKKNIVLGATGGDDNFYYLGINHRSKLLARPEVRKAISLAIDRQRFIELFFTHNGIVAKSILPPLHLAADFQSQHVRFDLEEAKKLIRPWQKELAQTKLVMMVKNSPEARQVGEFMQASLAKLDIQIELEMLPFNRMVERAMKGDFDLFYLAWFVGIPLVEEFLTPFQTGSTYNRFHYSSNSFDQSFAQILKTADQAEKKRLVAVIAKHLDTEMPVIPLLHAKTLFVHWPWLRYFTPNETSFGADMYYDIDIDSKQH